jgi:hypothetical protein
VVCGLSRVLEGGEPAAVEVLATAGRHVGDCPRQDPSRTPGGPAPHHLNALITADGYWRSGSGSPEVAVMSILWMSRFRG